MPSSPSFRRRKVYEVVLKHKALLKRQLRPQRAAPPAVVRELEVRRGGLWKAYARCSEIYEEYAKNFYLSTSERVIAGGTR